MDLPADLPAHLPAPIQAYLDADERNDGEALVRAFARDAVVRDEGQLHAGRASIESWWRDAKVKYRHVIKPLDVTEAAGVTQVRARVTGQFPGSPLTLIFAFRLKDGLITGLEIGA